MSSYESSIGMVTLLTVMWHDQVRRYCRWSHDLVIEENLYTSLPTCSIKYPENHGGSEEKPLTFDIDATIEPFATMALGYAFPIVTVLIQEVAANSIQTPHTLYRGIVSTTHRNPFGKRHLIKVTCNSAKSMLRIPLGMVASSTCNNIFGDEACKFDRSQYDGPGVIHGVSVDGNPMRCVMSFKHDQDAPDLSYNIRRRGKIDCYGLGLTVAGSLWQRCSGFYSAENHGKLNTPIRLVIMSIPLQTV